MKKIQWAGVPLMAVVILLAGCNQAEDQSEQSNPSMENAEIEEDEQTQADSQENDELVSKAETFINQLSEGKYEEATEDFDETMAEQLGATELEELWETLQDQLGDFIDYEYHSTEEAEGYQVVLLTGIFNEADVAFQVTFDDNQQIAGFYVQ